MANTFIICNNEDEIKLNKSCWGNVTLELSEEDIMALLKGKTLAADAGEYGLFIKLGDWKAMNIKCKTCAITREPDTLCPCKAFREATDGTVCHCGRYLKGEQNDQA